MSLKGKSSICIKLSYINGFLLKMIYKKMLKIEKINNDFDNK